MKTPEQIAAEVAKNRGIPSWAMRGADLSADSLMIAAINADRAQRDPNEDGSLHGAAIIALRERPDPAESALDWIEGNPDEFWDRYAGPMLDQIEQNFG